MSKEEQKAYNRGYYAGRKKSVYSPEWMSHQIERINKEYMELIARPKHIARVMAKDIVRGDYYVLPILDVQVTGEGTVVIVQREKQTTTSTNLEEQNVNS